MMSTRPPLPCTLSDLMSESTGSAFSTGVSCQPPAPKLSGPPIMIRPQPWSCGVAADHLLLVVADQFLRNVGQDDAVEVAQEDGQLVVVLVVLEYTDRLGARP